MSIKIGNNNVKEIYLGTQVANSVYKGTELVWNRISSQIVSFVYGTGRESWIPNSSLYSPRPLPGSILSLYSKDENGNELTPVTNTGAGYILYQYDYMGKRGAAYFEAFFPQTIYNPTESRFYSLGSDPVSTTGLIPSSISMSYKYIASKKTDHPDGQNLLYAGYHLVYDDEIEGEVYIQPNYTGLDDSNNVQSGKCRVISTEFPSGSRVPVPLYVHGNYMSVNIPDMAYRNQDSGEPDTGYATIKLSAPTLPGSAYAVIKVNYISMSICVGDEYYTPNSPDLKIGFENELRTADGGDNGVHYFAQTGTDEQTGTFYIPLGRQGAASDAESIVSKNGQVWINLRAGAQFDSQALGKGGYADVFNVTAYFMGYADKNKQIIETPEEYYDEIVFDVSGCDV